MSTKNKIRGGIWCLLGVIGLSLASCDSNNQGNQYDSGYEAAWSGESKSSFSSGQFGEGYEQGLADAYMYDAGFDDAADKRGPKHPRDPDYMDGYKDGKKA